MRAVGPVTLLPVLGLPEVRQGADLAALIAARADLADGDVVVVAQKVVSKAEGARIAVDPEEDLDAARRRHARAQARRIVADVPWVLIVETTHGLVCANGGLDASNVPDGGLLRLPDDPDGSARDLRAELRRLTGADVGVVISDTFGRPWRLGQTEVAIGAAGIAVLRDERVDAQGRELAVTEPAIADTLAAATDLVRRKHDRVPVVVVRGAQVDADPTGELGAADLQRTGPGDLFARGAGMVAAALAHVTPAPAVPAGAQVWEAAVAAARAVDDAVVVEDRAAALLRVQGAGPHAGVAAGAAAVAAVAACLDTGGAARWAPEGPTSAVVRVGGQFVRSASKGAAHREELRRSGTR